MKHNLLINSTRLIVCFMLFYMLVFTPKPVKACSCVIPGSPSTEFSEYDAVFTGKVVSIKNKSNFIVNLVDRSLSKMGFYPLFFYTENFWGNNVTFEVSKSWKYVDSTFVQVSTGYGGGDCGYTFAVGSDYLVYANHAYGKPGNYLVTGICGRTTEISNAADDLTFLNSIQTIPLSARLQISTWQICGGVFLLIAIFLVGFVFIRRRKQLKE